MQLECLKPKLKPPGSKRLKLKWETLLSISAFKFNLRRYSMALVGPNGCGKSTLLGRGGGYILLNFGVFTLDLAVGTPVQLHTR